MWWPIQLSVNLAENNMDCKILTQVEVVLHAVAEDQDTANGVDQGCSN